MLISCLTEPSSVASTTAVLGPVVDPITRPSPRRICPAERVQIFGSPRRQSSWSCAKACCTDCPARVACLAGALRRWEPCGVWGGEIFDRGRIVARKRPRGRPRKPDVAA